MDEVSVGWHILGDWGASRLRLFRVESGRIVDRIDGAGIGALDVSPAATLAGAMAAWQDGPPPGDILLCGMAGARGGLAEVGYVTCPATLDTWRHQVVPVAFEGLTVRIAPGLSYRDAGGIGDVMRGEETQIFGAIASDPALDRGKRICILPGTHSKWVDLDDGAFEQGFADGLDRAGEPLLGALFAARAAQLLDGRSPGWAKGYLSGLLIGGEVAAAGGGAVAVTLIGELALCARYAVALDRAGVASGTIDGDAAVLAGLALLGNMDG